MGLNILKDTLVLIFDLPRHHNAQLLRRLPTRLNLIAQNHILPSNLRQRGKTGIGPYLYRRLMLKLS